MHLTTSNNRARLVTFCVAGGLPLLLGCAGTKVFAGKKVNNFEVLEAPRTHLTTEAARSQFSSSLNRLWGTNVRDVKFTRRKVTFEYERTQAWRDIWPDDPASVNDTIVLASVKNLSYRGYGHDTEVRWEGHSRMLFKGPYGAAFVDAMSVLREAALTNTEPAEFAAFQVAAGNWLAANPRPAMSDEARTYKLLAEDAVSRKDLAAARDAYAKGLAIEPMWADGQYNAGVLAAEAEEYEQAANHMRRYLVLNPDAKDAVTAKDKLLVWQHLADQ